MPLFNLQCFSRMYALMLSDRICAFSATTMINDSQKDQTCRYDVQFPKCLLLVNRIFAILNYKVLQTMWQARCIQENVIRVMYMKTATKSSAKYTAAITLGWV